MRTHSTVMYTILSHLISPVYQITLCPLMLPLYFTGPTMYSEIQSVFSYCSTVNILHTQVIICCNVYYVLIGIYFMMFIFMKINSAHL